MKSRQTISPKQFAAALGVSESSIKRWCDQGSLEATRTPGGHRRIPIDTAVAFARQTGRPIARPELLGMSASNRATSFPEMLPLFTRDLLAGNEQSIREMSYDLFLRHVSLADVFDKVMRPSLITIGLGRDDGSVKEFEERRAHSILSTILTELRSEVRPDLDGPIACGGTRDNATLGICSQMVELVLRSEGWNAFCLGAICPVDVLIEAGQHMKPKLVWYAAVDTDEGDYAQDCISLETQMNALNIPLFIGSPAAESIGGLSPNTRASNSLSEFVAYLRNFYQRPTN